METILSAFQNFLNTLDWTFISGLMVVAYFFNKLAILPQIANVYKTVIVGIVLAIAIYFIRGYGRAQLEGIIWSYFVATSFYELAIGKILERFNLK
jgi:hypothetical protein